MSVSKQYSRTSDDACSEISSSIASGSPLDDTIARPLEKASVLDRKFNGEVRRGKRTGFCARYAYTLEQQFLPGGLLSGGNSHFILVLTQM